MTTIVDETYARPVLEIDRVSKRFGSLLANDDISLDLGRGEVLALLGENGAGKTTLVNILFGHYTADAGRVRVAGRELPPGNTHAALEAGLGMVHQHFTLADNLSVLDNVTLGTEPLLGWRSRHQHARRRLLELARSFGLAVDPGRLVGDLSVGERQRVEILKALYRGAGILILDEPTAVLTPQESEHLFHTLRRMVGEGLSVVFISHKMHEILAVSDRVAVLRRGRKVGEVSTAETDRHALAELMVGRTVTRPVVAHLDPGDPVLTLDGVSLPATGGRGALQGVALELREREIVGVAGVAGNGQGALADLLCGLRGPGAGRVLWRGATVSTFSPRRFVAMGVARIPEDRHAAGVFPEMSLWENLQNEALRRPPFWRGGVLIDRAACRRHAAALIEQFDIRCESMDMPARLLSGGNMQKLILARVLHRQPRLIVANQPVRGLDEGAIAFVHERLLEAKAAGAAVLLVSEDLDELLALADRVVVMHRGRMSRPVPTVEVDARDLGLMMSGDLDHAPQGAAA
jgi:simple sugar transport system ATP-binding protein